MRRDGCCPPACRSPAGAAPAAGRPGFVARAHARGHPVFVWTVDEPDDVDFVLDLGVDTIITNRPAEVHRPQLGTGRVICRVVVRYAPEARGTTRPYHRAWCLVSGGDLWADVVYGTSRRASRLYAVDWPPTYGRTSVADDSIEDVVLVTSELVSNAIRHTPDDGPIEVIWWLDQAELVATASWTAVPPTPSGATRHPHLPGGRGLAIVEALADSLGRRLEAVAASRSGPACDPHAH